MIRQPHERSGLHVVSAMVAAATRPALGRVPQGSASSLQTAQKTHWRAWAGGFCRLSEAARKRSARVADIRRMLPHHHFAFLPRPRGLRGAAPTRAARDRRARQAGRTRGPRLVGRLRVRRRALHVENTLGPRGGRVLSRRIPLDRRHRRRPDDAGARAAGELRGDQPARIAAAARDPSLRQPGPAVLRKTQAPQWNPISAAGLAVGGAGRALRPHPLPLPRLHLFCAFTARSGARRRRLCRRPW